MSQTPTLDSPIFSQLNVEFAAEGSSYEELVNWTAPEFVWDPNRPVVQLDKQTRRGVKVRKLSDAIGRELPAQIHSDLLHGTKLPAPVAGINDKPEALAEHKEIQSESELGGKLLADYIAMVGRKFAAHHPLALVTDMRTEVNPDGSATVVFEAVQPITPDMPLPDKDAAEPME